MSDNIFIYKYFSLQKARMNKLKRTFEFLLNRPNLTDGMRKEIERDLSSDLSIDVLYKKWVVGVYYPTN